MEDKPKTEDETMWTFSTIKADDDSGDCAHCEQEFESGDTVAVDTKLTGDGDPCDVIVAHPECREVFLGMIEIHEQKVATGLRVASI